MPDTIIYDTNNWIRVKLSTDGDNLTINNFWSEVVYKAQLGHIQIFVSDGIDSRRVRKSLYPEYKAKRKPADSSIYDGINLFKNFLLHAPANVLRCEIPHAEADDVIANLVKKRHLLGIPSPIEIVSTDKDLTQLLKYGSEIRTLAKLPEGVEPKWVHLYKTLVGDASDNIPGVPGMGKSAFMKLPEDIRTGISIALDTACDFDPETDMWLDKNLTPKLKENFFECFYSGNMELYWKITDFFDIRIEDLKLKAGDGRLDIVTKEMNSLFIV